MLNQPKKDSPIVVDVQTNDSDLDGDALTTENFG